MKKQIFFYCFLMLGIVFTACNKPETTKVAEPKVEEKIKPKTKKITIEGKSNYKFDMARLKKEQIENLEADISITEEQRAQINKIATEIGDRAFENKGDMIANRELLRERISKEVLTPQQLEQFKASRAKKRAAKKKN